MTPNTTPAAATATLPNTRRRPLEGFVTLGHGTKHALPAQRTMAMVTCGIRGSLYLSKELAMALSKAAVKYAMVDWAEDATMFQLRLMRKPRQGSYVITYKVNNEGEVAGAGLTCKPLEEKLTQAGYIIAKEAPLRLRVRPSVKRLRVKLPKGK